MITVPTLFVAAVVFMPPIALLFWGLWSLLTYLEPQVLRWWLHRDGYTDEEIDQVMIRAADKPSWLMSADQR